MVPNRSTSQGGGRATRPFAFLVSTTDCARDIRGQLGSAAYSYYFVLEALAPLLERHGTWRLLDRPESRLPYVAARAAAEGARPVHLALNPPQDCYLTPALPNVIFPFWEFPDIPDRDFDADTRQNWARVCGRAALIVTACHFTARAFHRAGVRCPISVVPVPIAPEHFDLPDWDPKRTWSVTCRHLVWGGSSAEPVAAGPPSPPAPIATPAASWKGRTWRAARGGYRRIAPWLGPTAERRIALLKRAAFYAAGRSPTTREPLPSGRPSLGRLAYVGLRAGYRRYVRVWLSDEARRRIGKARDAALRRLGRPLVVVIDPLLPESTLTLGGLVYTTVFNLGDPRKNYTDLLSAFLLAFRDRPDVTLVIKLVTNKVREHHEVGILRRRYEGLGIDHDCRVAVITEYLSDEQMRELMRTTTYYVNTSHAEGACLPLQQALAGGRPALAPGHSAMSDYMDDRVGFVLQSHPEPAPWPHDPRRRLETHWHRLVWSDLHAKFLASATVAETDPARYADLAAAARRRMHEYASRPVVEAALREALDLLPDDEPGAFAWAS